MELNEEQIEIMIHTMRRAAGRMYCGNSPDMQALVEAGYMAAVGKKSFCPDEYFRITKEGEKALAEVNHA